MNAPDPLELALQAKTPLIQLGGSPLHDITPEEQGFVTRRELLRRQLQKDNTVLIVYSLSESTTTDLSGFSPTQERTINQVLQRHKRNNTSLANTIQGLVGLLRETNNDSRFVVLVLNAERCFPKVHDPAFLAEDQLRMREQVAALGTALQLRRSGNTMILAAERDTLDPAIEKAATHVERPFPDATEKQNVFVLGFARYPNARLDDNLTIEQAARLTSHTANLDTEALVRYSHCTSTPITTTKLFEQKQEAVRQQTDGVLILADLTHSKIELVGAYLRTARKELEALCRGLASGDQDTPTLAVVHGPPGVGKTRLVMAVAAAAGIAVYELQPIASKWVGDSETRSKKMHTQRARPEFTPNIIIADEMQNITTQRDAGNDGGVSAALHKDWLTTLADPKYRGRSLVIATTNVPKEMPAALQSRTEFIPVFGQSLFDTQAITAHLCAQSGFVLEDPDLIEAANILYSKGASPRDIENLLRRLRRRNATPDQVKPAAEDLLVPESQWQATICCDYWSLQTMTGRAALPWQDRDKMSAHLAAVLDENGAIKYDQIKQRLHELSHVQV